MNTRHRLLPAVACAFVVVAMTLWPADVPWGADDAKLVAIATAANAAGRPAAAGLVGTFSVPYGPVPAQIYQAMLCVTHDLPTLVRLRAAVTAAVTAAALLWLAASLGWSAWLAPLSMLSPFFWFYDRLLWDNTFAIPIGAALVAGYAAHLRGRRGLTVAAAAAAVLPLIHPMTLPLVVTFAGHAAWARRPELARRWGRLAVVAVVVLATSGPYLLMIAHRRPSRPRLPSDDGYAPMSLPAAAAYPLLSGRLFSGFRFYDFRGPEVGWETTLIGTAARAASAVAFPLVWVGLAVTLRRRAPTIAVLCAAALAMQSGLDAVARFNPYPHYFCGTWAAAVVCLWTGVRSLGRWSVPVAVAYAAALMISTAAFAVDVHRGHTAVWHGPTLGQQVAAGTVPPVR